MKIISPKIPLRVRGASQAWPQIKPTSNLDLLQQFPSLAGKSDTFLKRFDDKIRDEFGMGERYLSKLPWLPLEHTNETSESLAIAALDLLFADTGIAAPEMFILGSTTSHRYTGSQAASAMGKFGLKPPAFEIKSGCSTSLAALHMGLTYLQNHYDDALICCAETMSKVIHPEIKETWFGLADGAASIWLERSDNPQFIVDKMTFGTNGKFVDLYTTKGVLPPLAKDLDYNGYYLSGDSAAMKTLAIEYYESLIDEILPSQQERDNIKWIVPHQANKSLISSIAKRKGLAHADMIWTADRFGNIGGASLLFALASAIKDKRFDQDGGVLLISVGGGLSYAAQVWQVVS